jgi:hypothetical protein
MYVCMYVCMYMLQYELTKGTAMNKSAGSKLMTAFGILPHCQLQLPTDFWQVSLAKGTPADRAWFGVQESEWTTP